jgi:hypothetical protein
MTKALILQSQLQQQTFALKNTTSFYSLMFGKTIAVMNACQ